MLLRLIDLHALIAIALVAAGDLWLTPIERSLVIFFWFALAWVGALVVRRSVASLGIKFTGRLGQGITQMLATLPADGRAVIRLACWTDLSWALKLAALHRLVARGGWADVNPVASITQRAAHTPPMAGGIR